MAASVGYVQITRGVAKRTFRFRQGIAPTVLVTDFPMATDSARAIEQESWPVTHVDERLACIAISRALHLLGNVLMKQYAIDQGTAKRDVARRSS
jgi:D-alanine transaminase